MRFGTGKIMGALVPALLLLAAVAASAAANPLSGPGVRITAQGSGERGASAAASITFLTINDLTGVDNRINVFTGPTGRLTLIAPEGLTDPDGEAGPNCALDNALPGQTMATQISCTPGYAQAIVGDLGIGDDTFMSAPDLPLALGGIFNGQRRPLFGGTGGDRIVGGALDDLIDGGAGGDALIGNGGEDQLAGGGGRDRLGGGAASDVLLAGGGRDKLNGGPARDLCNGGGGRDSARRCEILQALP